MKFITAVLAALFASSALAETVPLPPTASHLVQLSAVPQYTFATTIEAGPEMMEFDNGWTYVNVSGVDVSVSINGVDHAIPPDGMVVMLGGGTGTSAKACSIVCDDGYYSCCEAYNIPPLVFTTCVCLLDGTTIFCSAGGPGSSECSISI